MYRLGCGGKVVLSCAFLALDSETEQVEEKLRVDTLLLHRFCKGAIGSPFSTSIVGL
jgi:hypothetical protein